MSETARLSKQLEKTFVGKAWHGPSVEEALSGTGAELAARPSPRGAHSIWQIVLHMIAWQEAVLRMLDGGYFKLSKAEDWPRVSDTDEAAWQQTLARLRRGNEALR